MPVECVVLTRQLKETEIILRFSLSCCFKFYIVTFICPGLETVDRFPILGAVTGILLTLLMDGTSERFVFKVPGPAR